MMSMAETLSEFMSWRTISCASKSVASSVMLSTFVPVFSSRMVVVMEPSL